MKGVHTWDIRDGLGFLFEVEYTKSDYVYLSVGHETFENHSHRYLIPLQDLSVGELSGATRHALIEMKMELLPISDCVIEFFENVVEDVNSGAAQPKTELRCECGAEKLGYGSHSTWCPKYAAV